MMSGVLLLPQHLYSDYEIVLNKCLLIELYCRIMDLDQIHYQNYPDKIIIKSELVVICGETGFPRQWKGEG